MTKKLPTDIITRELSRSVFFQKPAAAQSYPQPQENKQVIESHSPTTPTYEQQRGEEVQQGRNVVSKRESKTDVMLDVMTSHLLAANLKRWQEIIENTETQNSALRLTSEERYAVEDVVNELRRQYGIKTSMNELARLGLLLLLSDFKTHKKESLIHQVKKA